MSPDEIAALFTRDGRFLCARWPRPIAPVLFGLDAAQMPVFRSAIAAALHDAGAILTDADPESGANLIVFLVRDWAELQAVPDLDRLIGVPDLPRRLARDAASGSAPDHYRLFRFDPVGAIRACFSFLHLPRPEHGPHPAALAESIAVNALLTFGRWVSPSRPLAALIRAAYDPVLPDCATDASHALRLHARMAARSGRT